MFYEEKRIKIRLRKKSLFFIEKTLIYIEKTYIVENKLPIKRINYFNTKTNHPEWMKLSNQINHLPTFIIKYQFISVIGGYMVTN